MTLHTMYKSIVKTKIKRQTSRGYQALVLLSIARKGLNVRTLLREWATGMDVDMSVAAKIGLALNGEMSAFIELQQLTQTTNRKRLLRNIRAGVFAQPQRTEPVLFSETETCQICGSRVRYSSFYSYKYRCDL